MLVRCDADGKLYLYDLVRTKKKRAVESSCERLDSWYVWFMTTEELKQLSYREEDRQSWDYVWKLWWIWVEVVNQRLGTPCFIGIPGKFEKNWLFYSKA